MSALPTWRRCTCTWKTARKPRSRLLGASVCRFSVINTVACNGSPVTLCLFWIVNSHESADCSQGVGSCCLSPKPSNHLSLDIQQEIIALPGANAGVPACSSRAPNCSSEPSKSIPKAPMFAGAHLKGPAPRPLQRGIPRPLEHRNDSTHHDNIPFAVLLLVQWRLRLHRST